MNVAIGISTLLLGSWVLNTPVEQDQSDAAALLPSVQAAAPALEPRAQYPSQAPSPGAGDANSGRFPRLEQLPPAAPDRSGLRRSQLGNQPTNGPDSPLGDLEKGNQVARPNDRQREPKILPRSPTDAPRLAGPGEISMPLPPTASQAELDANGRLASGAQPGSPTMSAIPELPTSRRVNLTRSASSGSYYEGAEDERARLEMTMHPGFTARSAPPAKAFADYRPSSSGVSPYMGIFRNDTNGGTIDNYSTLVRPALDQRNMNQRFNMDIYGLERNSRLQDEAMRQLNQGNTRTLQSIGTPQFYMNYGNYYPGYGQVPGSGP